MKVHFWGTRGAIPVSITESHVREKISSALKKLKDSPVDLNDDEAINTFINNLAFDVGSSYGGHTSCVQIDTGEKERVILDVGSGAKVFGQYMLDRLGTHIPQVYHIFLSHLHVDHIMGFPFFAPAYLPETQIIIHSCNENTELAFRSQQRHPFSAIHFDQLTANIMFNQLQPDITYNIAGMQVTAKRQRHMGDSFGWRFEKNDKTLVYATDAEYHIENVHERESAVRFFQNADAVIFDAMYSFADSMMSKADEGHSSNIIGVELCQEAKARRLVMFHHDPSNDDATIDNILEETRRFEEITREDKQLEILSAYDGLEIDL